MISADARPGLRPGTTRQVADLVGVGPIMANELSRRVLEGLRILVVEDEFLVATHIKRLLAGWGCEIVGPAPSLDDGQRLAQSENLDGAILDININGGNSVPIADTLRDRDLPFIFITGYASPRILPQSLAAMPRLHKPIDESMLEAVLVKEFAKA
jgi:DNA-binding LytR/AlgR family response regulator